MKTRWNKRRLVPVALVIALVLVCGAVYAYMFRHIEGVSTTFIPAKVSCLVSETFAENKKSEITVKNTSDIPAYLRIRLVSYWIDMEGNVAAKASPALPITPNETKWLKGSDNTFYYKTPVKPDGVTEDLLNGEPIALVTEDGGKYRQVVDVFAEAIQADPTAAATQS